MTDNHLLHLLNYLNIFITPVYEGRIRKSVLDNAKLERKGLDKETILEKGLNIFEKRTISVDSLIEEGVDRGFVELSFSEENNEYQLLITPEGKEFVLLVKTQNYCDEFLEFEASVNKMTDKNEETAFPLETIASCFYQGTSVDEIEREYLNHSAIGKDVEAFHSYYLNLLGIAPSEEEFIWHIAPEIFLPKEWKHEDVTLRIEGVDVPGNLVVGRPYPNKRYVVAGTGIEKNNLLTGFYVTGTREEFEGGKTLRYIWSIGEDKTLIHEMKIEFNFDKSNFFSTKQRCNRSVVIPTFNLVSHTDEFGLKHNRNVTIQENGETTLLTEVSTLTSFPVHLHFSFNGNKTYQDWLVKNIYS